MDAEKGFWLGLAVAVPIGFAVNLLTPLLQTLLARLSSRLRSRNKKNKDQLDGLISDLASDSEYLRFFILSRLVGLIGFSFFVAFLFGVVTLFILIEHEVPGLSMTSKAEKWSVVIFIGSAAIGAYLMSLYLLTLFRSTASTIHRVAKIKEWRT